MKSLNDSYTLHNGVQIPCVGFGMWQTPNGEVAVSAVKEAIAAGYRHIDTAQGYENEESVGIGVRESGVPREELFITSKLTNSEHGYDRTMRSFEESMKKLATDYLDLFLIHWPNPVAFRDRWQEMNAGSWRAFEELYEAGRIKSIGISNFMPHHIDALMETARIKPMVNQIKLCPGVTQPPVVDYCTRHDILLEAYSPLGTGRVFDIPELKRLSEKHGKTIAQICLRWSLQMGWLPLPKSVTASRIKENTAIFDFDLAPDEVERITTMTGAGEAADPDAVNF